LPATLASTHCVNVAISICVSWPARVDACDDSICAAVALPVSDAWSPRHCADWYVLHAVATAATASITVATSSIRLCRRSWSVRGSAMSDLKAYANTFTARAITRPTTANEIIDCRLIVNFAHGDSGMTSVGLNAMLVVKPSAK
jgi:hypothetical protein